MGQTQQAAHTGLACVPKSLIVLGNPHNIDRPVCCMQVCLIGTVIRFAPRVSGQAGDVSTMAGSALLPGVTSAAHVTQTGVESSC